jgi:hypothetical protein
MKETLITRKYTQVEVTPFRVTFLGTKAYWASVWASMEWKSSRVQNIASSNGFLTQESK